MAKTREIKKRIKAVGNIRRITKTMQMIATAKFAQAQARATATKPYTEGVFELVTELGATAGDISHPLIAGPTPGSPAAKAAADAQELFLIITSDRGLCGAYNSSVLRTAIQAAREGGDPGKPATNRPLVELIGKKGAAALRYNNFPIEKLHTLGDKPSYEAVERIAAEYMDRFIRGEIKGVRVISMRFISAGKQTPAATRLLPLKAAPAPSAKKDVAASGPKSGVVYEFSPPAEELLAELLPAAVKATLFQAVNEALVSEHIARMIAMKAATDNAGKMGKLLTRKYNRARQAQITTELTEIVTGAAALE